MIQQSNFIFCILLLASLFSSVEKTFAQKTNKRTFTYNLMDYDDRPLRFGIAIGVGRNIFGRQYSKFFNTGVDTTLAVSPRLGLTGPILQGFFGLKLSEKWDLRVAVGYNSYQREIDFNYINGQKVTKVLEGASVEFPVVFKYKSNRRGNVRMYMVGGGKLNVEVGARKNQVSTEGEL
ncbi:MAG: outer membrane beta-barrel protein, partial [Verrucomicrobia bacterium]|nr:outer membrane beta-barrel protein [Cytophagales bacterium]